MKVYSGGTFDSFHVGHIELLEYCRMLGDYVVISLNTDDFVSRYKGRVPTIPYVDRKKMLLATKYVDEVIPNYEGEDSRPAILEAKPDIIVIGMDWLEKDYCKQMGFDAEWLNKHKIGLFYAPRTTGESTTSIKERIKSA